MNRINKFESYSRFLTWFMALLLVALAAGCGGGGGGGRDPILGAGGIAGIAPTVTAVAPLRNATGVPINTKIITAAFSKAMDPATLTPASITLACPAGTPVTGAVSYLAAGNVATLTLPAATTLPTSTVCTATVTTGAKDTTGIPLASNFTWTFTTGVATDTTAPSVSSTGPVPNATGVARNTLVTASFSEPMDPLTITTATVTLACPAGTAITGSVGYAVNGNVATLTPASTLPANTICTATITTGVKDVAGNAMASAFTWTFTTGATADTTAPSVSSTVPVANASGVALNTLVTASFSEPMDPLTITTATVTLACPAGTTITGTVGYAVNGNVATLTPASALPANTICTATITTGVKDVAGNAMASAFTWTFTTGATADTTAPSVSSTVPVANASGVALNALVTASFNEPMDPLTITTATVTLACPAGTAITGTVGYAVNGNVATLTPTSALAANTICTATITTGVKDVAGNAMSSAFTWTFTAGAATDTTAPSVSSTVPVAGATGVAINSPVNATFSEAMDPLTITTATFTLACPAGTAITGTVGYALGTNVATFAPGSSLPASTTCTATITGARDLAGNALVPGLAPNPWTFTTAAALPGPGPAPVILGSTLSRYAVIAGSTVTNTGPSLITGAAGTTADLGVSPGSAVTGFPPGTVNGAMQVANPDAAQAKLELTTAYNDAQGRTLAPITVAGNIGGQTLAPGLYKSTSSLAISSGDLTLAGPADGVWIFQVASTLTTTSGRQVILSGGALAKNIFWAVGSSATLGTNSVFQGNILADQSITLTTGAVLNGRALTRIGAVTLDSNTVTRPAP